MPSAFVALGRKDCSLARRRETDDCGRERWTLREGEKTTGGAPHGEGVAEPVVCLRPADVKVSTLTPAFFLAALFTTKITKKSERRENPSAERCDSSCVNFGPAVAFGKNRSRAET